MQFGRNKSSYHRPAEFLLATLSDAVQRHLAVDSLILVQDFPSFEEEITRNDGANRNSQVFALAFFQSDLVFGKRIWLPAPSTCHSFAALVSINHDFFWRGLFLKQEKDSLIMRATQKQRVTLSDSFVVLAQ